MNRDDTQAPMLAPTQVRRRMLIGLATVAPALSLLGATPVRAAPTATADPTDTADVSFLTVSRVITGAPDLSADVARRIRLLLAARDSSFSAKFDSLAKTMDRAGGDRAHRLAALSDEQVKFALAIARPWYLGFVGKPSDFVLRDDAAFATFLQAQSWSKIVDEVPRPTYPGAAAGWWDVAPPGVQAPAMPDGITHWNFHPGGPAQILKPDPRWKAYATADHADIDAARRAKPGAAG